MNPPQLVVVYATEPPPTQQATAIMYVVFAVLILSGVSAILRRNPLRKGRRRQTRRSGARRPGAPKKKTSKVNSGNPETPARHTALGLESFRGLVEFVDRMAKEAKEQGARQREVRTQDQRQKKSTRKSSQP